MLTTEELLAQLEAEAQSETPVCVIDPETRTITVPPEYQLLGVENDKRVERIPFRCPKIVGDNQDLSQDYLLFVNYVNANGDPDAYKINDMQVDGDNITFSWLLEEKVTLYQGDIQISFCGIIPGDEQEDPDKNRWGTTINTDCTVLTGLKSTQQVAESNPDALTQIWAAIDELKAGGGGSGTPGKDGREVEIQNNGTAIQWRYVGEETWTDLVQLSDLKGQKGDPGDNGITPTIGENGNWYLGDEDTGKPSRGEQGPAGQDGDQGPAGPKGETGATPNIKIGTVQTLEPGQQATASMTGTPENPVLNLGIPKGEPGGGGIDNTSINLVNPYEYTNSGYSGTLFDEFGANVNVFNAEIDTSENKILYYRVYRNNQVYDHKIDLNVACYDSSGSFLFLMKDSTGDYVVNFESVSRENGNISEPLEQVGDQKVIVKQIALVNIPENVARVKFGIRAGTSNMVKDFYPVFAVSYSKITNYGSITDSDYSLTQGSTSDGGGSGATASKPLLNKTFLMIGDSLTNWGGGGDTANGFLKIVHDRTGVTTVNQGLAGATWEEAEGQTQPGVKRVDTYISGSVRYDCIGFLLGTNVSSVGIVSDTSETKTTMCGAIKYCLEQLITLSPTTPIIVFLPPQRAEGNTEQKARNDIIKQICEIYGVYTFDLYTRSQVIPNTTVTGNGTLSDGLHLSKKGQENFGRIMSTAILNVMGYY